MDIKNRLYPYPVLAVFNDDYLDSYFYTDVEDGRDGFEITFKVHSELKNDELIQMIKEGSAELLYHIECSRTGYREVTLSDKSDLEIRIPETMLNGDVHFCSFVVAKKELHDYVNKNFNPDNNDPVDLIEKGGILAIGNQFNFNIIKKTTELLATSSPFKIGPNSDPSINYMVVDYESSDNIKIKLCREDLNNYRAMIGAGDINDMLNSAIVVPALVYVLTQLAGKDQESIEADFGSLMWYQSIKASLKKNFHMDFTQLHNTNTFELAQKMLKIPINSALANMAMLNPSNMGEEDA